MSEYESKINELQELMHWFADNTDGIREQGGAVVIMTGIPREGGVAELNECLMGETQLLTRMLITGLRNFMKHLDADDVIALS